MGSEMCIRDSSTLVAQVRKAEASHKMDASNYLRSRHFQGPSNVVYLGDVGQAVLSQLSQPETPSFSEAPGYNEQRWTLETTSGELSVSIRSRPYWAWGLLTSGYLNIITLRGPLEARSRLVLDVVSSLGQPPWEFAHARQAGKYLAKNTVEVSTKSNEHTWKALLATGRDRLAEQIERMVRQRKERPIDESDEGWNEAMDEDLHMAWKAHAEDNAPGVERALARLEAALIHLDPSTKGAYVPAPEDRFSDGSDIFDGTQTNPTGGEPNASDILYEDEVPFLDLTQNKGPLEEE